jgi:hypothetical protein
MANKLKDAAKSMGKWAGKGWTFPAINMMKKKR